MAAEKRYCLRRNPPWNAIIGQLNPTHTLATVSVLYILIIRFHLFLGFSGSLLCSQHSYLVHLESRVEKGKAITLKTWTGPEVSKRMRLPYFKTAETIRY